MQRQIFGVLILSILTLFISFNPSSAGSTKTQALEQKIAEILSLRVKIMDKIDQAV